MKNKKNKENCIKRNKKNIFIEIYCMQVYHRLLGVLRIKYNRYTIKQI